jgi:uncharacterized protein (DUF1684 family)
MRGLRSYLLLLLVLCVTNLFGQLSYRDTLQTYLDRYVKDHEVVNGADKKYFDFYPVNETYRVIASFEKAKDNKWFTMETSGLQKKTYRIYGTISFTIHDTLVRASIYQSQNLLADPKYKDYLALMFTDKTTGDETYEAGRYIDLDLADIKNNQLVIDFNKAYNPYCAYVKGKYNCPIPPRENYLPVAIEAGEKSFGKKPE